jgi:hypothetical protein
VKTQKHIKPIWLAAALTTLLQMSSIAQPIISVQFAGRGDGNWGSSGVSTPLTATDYAGVEPARTNNWNSVSFGTSGAVSGSASALLDSSGTATIAGLSWAGSQNGWDCGVNPNGYANDNALFHGFLNSPNSTTAGTTVSFTGIPYTKYDVYVYILSDGAGRGGYVTAGFGVTNYYTIPAFDGGQKYAPLWGGTNGYVQITSTNIASRTTGTWAVFSNLTSSSFSIIYGMVSGNASGIAGIQIVNTGSGTATIPLAITAQPGSVNPQLTGGSASFSVSAISSSTPISYQWKHGPVGGPYTNLVDDARITGTTTPDLTLTSLELTDAGAYVVTATDAVTSQTSSEAILPVVDYATLSPYFTNALATASVPQVFSFNTGINPRSVVTVTTNGTILAGSGDGARAFVSTVYADYNTVDVVAQITVPTNYAFCSFFGIGEGVPAGQYSEPGNSIYIRARHDGGAPSLTGGTGGTFTAWPSGIGNGPFTMKVDYRTASGLVTFTIDNGFTNQSVQVALPSLSAGYHIFFGGNNGDIFTNLVVKNSIDPNATVTNLYFVSVPATNLLAGQTATYQVTLFADYLTGSKSNDVTASASYYTDDGGICSVSASGVLTVGTAGPTTLHASFLTATATQPVVARSPSALHIQVPQLYAGCRGTTAKLFADFGTITNVNVTGFSGVSGTWTSDDVGPTVLTVDATSALVTPVAEGVTNIMATYSGLTATQAVSVLSTPAFYRTDLFAGSVLPAGYYANLGNASDLVNVTAAGTVFVGAASGTRDYVVSAIPYYDQSNFVATITVKTNGSFGAFFGIGEGLGVGGFGEPQNSVYLRLKVPNWAGSPDVAGVSGAVFTKWPSGVGTGPLVVKLTYIVGTGISFTISDGNNTETTAAVPLPSLAQGYSIFFGGAENGGAQTYYNLKIQNPATIVPPTVTLGQSLSGANVTLTWADGLLQQATDLNGPWTAVSSANSPYSITINPAETQRFFRVLVP